MKDIFRAVVRRLSRWAWKYERSVCDELIFIKGLNANENGIELEIEQNPELAQWVVKCLASLVFETPNYNEIKLTTSGNYLGKFEWITVTIQKGTGKTPHQLRLEAEHERDALKAKLMVG